MPFSITVLSQAEICQHRQYNSHNVSWPNALVWQNTYIYTHTHIYVHAHIPLQHSLDTTISYIVSDSIGSVYWDKQCSPFKANGGNEQQGRGNGASSTSHRKWLTQLIPIVKPQPWKEFSSSNILLHHNDKPALSDTSKITCSCF